MMRKTGESVHSEIAIWKNLVVAQHRFRSHPLLSRAPDGFPASVRYCMPTSFRYPTTPDGRYFVVKGRLWRTSNPALAPDERQRLVDRLMDARRQVGAAKKAGDPDAVRDARAAVDEAKRALGERGPVWWHDGAPDLNRKMVKNTPYAQWHAALEADGGDGDPFTPP
jgi:hypothetical protein